MKNRVGESLLNNNNERMTIIKYNSSTDVVVEFNDKTKVNVTYGNFNLGKVKNPMTPTILNIGYSGIGQYHCHNDIKYKTWILMLYRCYDKKYQVTHPTYMSCSVDKEWHNYQNFAKWYEDNFYYVKNKIMNLDKDIKVKGNKIYSPETCIFIPNDINMLFQIDGKGYRKRSTNCFDVTVNFLKHKKYACFKTSELALQAYNNYKKQHLLELIELHKNELPKSIIDLLLTK